MTLYVFVFQVQVETPWRIPSGTAAQLIADAQRIRAVLGCGTGLFWLPSSSGGAGACIQRDSDMAYSGLAADPHD